MKKYMAVITPGLLTANYRNNSLDPSAFYSVSYSSML